MLDSKDSFISQSASNSSSQDKNSQLNNKRLEVAHLLNINLDKPQQEKRIEALFKLLKKHLHKSDTEAFILQKIIIFTDQLKVIYASQQHDLDTYREEFKVSGLEEYKIENINFKNAAKISELESKIIYYRQLLHAFRDHHHNAHALTEEQSKTLKDINEKCFDHWLKTLDINFELRNTIIGFHNRQALYKASNAYINYYIFVEQKINDTFNDITHLKKEGIKEFYEALSKYELPQTKLFNFKLFLQKKIESKLHDAMELKIPFGNAVNFDYSHIESNIELVKKEHNLQEAEMIAIINFYKKSLLNKQVLFTQQADELTSYLKDRFVEKINAIYQKASDYAKILKEEVSELSQADIQLLLHFCSNEYEHQLKKIKQKYSAKLQPLIDNFDNMLLSLQNKYAFDPEELERKSIKLKSLKTENMEAIVAKFEAEKKKIDDLFNDKKFLIADLPSLTISEAERLIAKLKHNCVDITTDILNFNQQFWTKLNAEFNSEAKRYLVKLRYEYLPWVHGWNASNTPWFHDYLVMNLNQEYLNAVGTSLKEFSPESKLYIDSSKALLQLNEYLREVFKNRDLLEYEHLIKLNTIPTIDKDRINDLCNEKLQDLKAAHDTYWTNYNNLYNQLIKSN